MITPNMRTNWGNQINYRETTTIVRPVVEILSLNNTGKREACYQMLLKKLFLTNKMYAHNYIRLIFLSNLWLCLGVACKPAMLPDEKKSIQMVELRSTATDLVVFMQTNQVAENTSREMIQNEERERLILFCLLGFVVSVGLGIGVCMLLEQRSHNGKAPADPVNKYPLDGNKAAPCRLTNTQKSDLLFLEFKRWLEKDKKYMMPHLSLNYVVREIGTNHSYLSTAINRQGVRFTDLINKYRIQEIVQIFEDPEDPRNNKNLDEIAAEVGFLSKSVFFEAFRKETGLTPNQYREFTRFRKLTDNSVTP